MLTTIGLAAAALLAGEEILDRAADAAGGDEWLNARTLVLSGTAVFYGPAGSEPRSRATDYRMWRVFDPARSAAHGAEGKVRILACDGKRQLFTVGYDGKTTWTERGVTPKAEADAFWASNFGFGIIRHARKPGFKAERVPDDIVGNHRLYMVRLTDPAGGTTLFGVDKQSFAIRSDVAAGQRQRSDRRCAVRTLVQACLRRRSMMLTLLAAAALDPQLEEYAALATGHFSSAA